MKYKSVKLVLKSSRSLSRGSCKSAMFAGDMVLGECVRTYWEEAKGLSVMLLRNTSLESLRGVWN